jgi:hypothetical protein
MASGVGGGGGAAALITGSLCLMDCIASSTRDPTRPDPRSCVDPTRPGPTRPDPARPGPTRPDPTDQSSQPKQPTKSANQRAGADMRRKKPETPERPRPTTVKPITWITAVAVFSTAHGLDGSTKGGGRTAPPRKATPSAALRWPVAFASVSSCVRARQVVRPGAPGGRRQRENQRRREGRRAGCAPGCFGCAARATWFYQMDRLEWCLPFTFRFTLRSSSTDAHDLFHHL